MKSKKSNKSLTIKLVFGLALLLFIAWKIRNAFSGNEFDEIAFKSIPLLIFAIVLMPLNWFLESLKWKLQLDKIEPHGLWQSVCSVLAGISTSIITPNRLGNFIGRSFTIDKSLRTKAIVSTIHGNLAQFMASILFGLIGLLFLNFSNGYVSATTVLTSGIVIISLGLLIYFRPKTVDFVPLSKMYSDQMLSGIDTIQRTSFGFKLTILVLSLARYLVYLIQFYILLLCFGGEIEPQVFIPAIAVVYLITSIVPSIFFGKLFVREVSALFVLTSYGVATPVILLTVFVLWLINLALPALAGGVILFKSK